MIRDETGKLVPRPRLYLSEKETARRLEPFAREAEAGIPDVELARLAEVSVSSVRFWRRKKKLLRKQRDKRDRISAQAMNLLGLPMGDVLQRAHSSVLDGEWRPPEYIVRAGVDYDALVHQIWVLTQNGFDVEEIAKAHGYTEQTIEQALVVYERQLAREKKIKEDG